MRKTFPILVLLLFTALSLWAEEFVSIYQDYQPDRWGRARERSGLISPSLEDLRGASTVEASSGGILTAVILNRDQGDQLLALLKERQTVTDGMITLSMVRSGEKPVLQWYHRGWEARYKFQLDSAPRELLSEIVNFYASDPYNGGLVDREYRDHYIIRIWAGEDILESDGRLSFGEALLGATLLGDGFQPLWGIHDGWGTLALAGLLKAAGDQMSVEESVSMNPADTEPPRRREIRRTGEWADFLHRVESLPGSFPENLYVYTRTVCALEDGGEDGYVTPSEFLTEKAGRDRDFALFFYSVLRDYGYEVRLVMINPGELMSNRYIVTFRESGSPLWGIISQKFYAGQRFSQWPRIPSLLYQRSVRYQELMGASILVQGEWIFPGSSDWTESHY